MEKLNNVRLVRLAHVYYAHQDLTAACQFLVDFGLFEVEHHGDRVFFRGYGSELFIYCALKGDRDEFRGAAWEVESHEDLQTARDLLPRATAEYDLQTPGGGRGVTFHDPVDQFPFHLVCGQAQRDNRKTLPSMAMRMPNFPDKKQRPANETVRMNRGPAPVHKLGHFGLCVTDFDRTYVFFTRYFNLKPSELVHDGSGRYVTTFMHLDRGPEWVDHHSFFFFEGPKAHVHHSSFEVHDFDVQLLGHDWLMGKRYELAWGVGRHVMGSQIFDYW